MKKPLLLPLFTQTKGCSISTPREKHIYALACGTEAPWLKTNTHNVMNEYTLLLYTECPLLTNNVEEGKATYGCEGPPLSTITSEEDGGVYLLMYSF